MSSFDSSSFSEQPGGRLPLLLPPSHPPPSYHYPSHPHQPQQQHGHGHSSRVQPWMRVKAKAALGSESMAPYYKQAERR